PLQLFAVGVTAFGKGNAALAVDDPVPGNFAARWQVAQDSTHQTGVTGQTSQLGDFAVSAEFALGDGGDGLENFLLEFGGGHGGTYRNPPSTSTTRPVK